MIAPEIDRVIYITAKLNLEFKPADWQLSKCTPWTHLPLKYYTFIQNHRRRLRLSSQYPTLIFYN